MKNVKRLAAYMKPYWWRIVLAGLASTAYGSMDAAFAYMVAPVLKKIFVTKDMFIFSMLPLGIVFIFLVRAICRFTNDYFIQTAGQLAIQDVRNELYRKNMSFGLRFFNRNQVGSLMSRVLTDVSQMQDGVGNIITSLFRDGVGVIALLGVVFYRNWQLAIISIVVLPVTIYPAALIGKKIKKVAKSGMEIAGDINSILQETFAGIKVIKAFGLEGQVIAKFADVNYRYYVCLRKRMKYSSLSAPVMEIITSIGIGAVVLFGGSKVMAAQMSAAEFFSFLTAMALLYSPFKKLIGSYNEIQKCLAAAERVFEIIDTKPEIVDSTDALEINSINGCIEFRNVSFKYNDEYVLRDISLSAQKGEVIAFVGPSGGGKTTLVSLIPRFFDADEGQILIDSHDVKDIKHKDLVKQIALVDQETTLFHDTIANNIRYGKPDASDDEVAAAAKAAYAHDFILELSDGYSTNIGDRGVRLSGGQRQRLCIARAILKNAPVLILDEATSALDTESEQMVQKALDNLMLLRTTFVIAHRLSTILHADKIVVIDGGKVVEQGTHEGLIAGCGLYKRLYEMQFKN